MKDPAFQEGQIVPKAWGEEEIITNRPAFCGKWLFVKPYFVCSEHGHRIKEEVFHVTAGMGVICVRGVCQRVTPGDTVHIPPGAFHCFATVDGMTLLEISTTHRDADVERLTESHRLSPETDGSLWEALGLD